jgi:hypothetical protein
MIDLSQSRITRSTKRGELAQTFINFPPMQKGANFNMEALSISIQKLRCAQNYGRKKLQEINESHACTFACMFFVS